MKRITISVTLLRDTATSANMGKAAKDRNYDSGMAL